MEPVIRLERVGKRYSSGPAAFDALRDVSLTVFAGELLAVIGPSGSGKSTLLNLMAGLDVPTAGRVCFHGRDLASLDEEERSRIRLDDIGFVFQSFNLFPALTAAENVGWPLELAGVPRARLRTRVADALRRVDMEDRGHRRPGQLSGGEQQRVAVARAIVNTPSVIFADEPTGNLDSANGAAVIELLDTLCLEHDVTVVVVSHQPDVVRRGRVVEIRDGRVHTEDAATRAVAP